MNRLQDVLAFLAALMPLTFIAGAMLPPAELFFGFGTFEVLPVSLLRFWACLLLVSVVASGALEFLMKRDCRRRVDTASDDKQLQQWSKRLRRFGFFVCAAYYFIVCRPHSQEAGQ